MFAVFDVDRDGFITVEEVFKVLESMGFLPSPASIDDIFRQVDLDGNTTASCHLCPINILSLLCGHIKHLARRSLCLSVCLSVCPCLVRTRNSKTKNLQKAKLA